MKNLKFLILSFLLVFSGLSWAERLMVQFNQLDVQYQNFHGLILVSPQTRLRGMAVFEFMPDINQQQKLVVIHQLRQLNGVNWVEEDAEIIAPQSWPNDPLLNQQQNWQEAINLPQVWQNKTDCGGVVVAIIDSGIDLEHPDLKANIWLNAAEQIDSTIDLDGNGYIGDRHGWSPISQNGNVSDIFGHGTHVAGLIGAIGNNAEGVAGVCWDVQLLPLRFLNRHGGGAISHAVQGIYYVLDLQEDYPDLRYIINNSWAASYSQALDEAIKAATDAGVLVVNAAGNSGRDIDVNPVYPAQSARLNFSAITVANVDTRDSSFSLNPKSNYGQQTVTLAAPGTNILSTWPTQKSSDPTSWYQFEDGSSMSAPIVSGIAALLWSSQPNLTARDIRAILENSLIHFDDWKPKLKAAGLVDAYQAWLNQNQRFFTLGYALPESSAVYGVNLDLVSSLRLADKSIDFVHDVQQDSLILSHSEHLVCGWLSADSAGAQQAELYLDWLPSTPVITGLVPLTNNQVRLSWHTAPNVSLLEIRLLAADGGVLETKRVSAGQQVWTGSLAEDARIQVRSVMQCINREAQPTERFSGFTQAKSASELVAPIWKTVGLSQVYQEDNFRFALEADYTDRFEMLASDCEDGTVNLSVDGALSGRFDALSDCRVTLRAVSDLTGFATEQVFALQSVARGEQRRLVFEDTQWHPDLSFTIDGVDSAQLKKVEGEYVFSWHTLEPIFEVVLSSSSHRISNVNWYLAGGAAEIEGLNLDSNQARFIVEAPLTSSEAFGGEYSVIVEMAAAGDNSVLESKPVVDESLETKPVVKETPDSKNEDDDSHCFLARKIAGNDQLLDLVELRMLRDQMLVAWPKSKLLVDYYYEVSPGLIELADDYPSVFNKLKPIIDVLVYASAGLTESLLKLRLMFNIEY